jgi:segregation and condensation protein B
MARTPRKSKDKSDDALGLAAFRQVPASGGLPLDQLSSALGGLLESGDDPYSTPRASAAEAVDTVVAEPEEESCEITPRTILEAMLFVDGPRNEPLSSKHVASLMRGVRPAEIDALVQQLNADYARRRCPYTIVNVGAGYRLVLHPRYERLRDKVLGRSRRAQLSQAAIEVLAAVAYHEPVTADEISRMRGTPSGHVLAHLVRRQLLRLERGSERPRRSVFYTTPRFLTLFGLGSLAELPRSSDLENA